MLKEFRSNLGGAPDYERIHIFYGLVQFFRGKPQLLLHLQPCLTEYVDSFLGYWIRNKYLHDIDSLSEILVVCKIFLAGSHA